MLRGLLALALVVLAAPWAPAAGEKPLWSSEKLAGDILAIAVSPDGQMIATGGQDGIVRLFQADGTLSKTLKGHQQPVRTLLFHPNGQFLYSGGDDQTVRTWSLAGGSVHLQKVQGSVLSLAVFPDGKQLVVGADQVNLVSPRQGVTKHWPSRNQGIQSCDVSPDGQRILTADGDAAMLWDTQGKLVRRLTETEFSQNAGFTPDGRHILTSADATHLWTAQGELVRRFDRDSDGEDMALSRDGQLVALAGNIHGLSQPGFTLFNAYGRFLTRVGVGHDFYRIALSPDRRTAYVTEKGQLSAWAMPELDLHLPVHPGLTHMAVFPSGGQWATGGADGSIKIWNADKRLVTGWQAHQGDVAGLAIAPHGRTLASAGPDGLKLWQADGTLIASWPAPGTTLTGVAFAPDGSWLVTGAYDGKVRLWKRETGLFKTLDGHAGIVWGVAVHPDGQILASASDDKTVRLWSSQGKQLKTLTDHTNWVWSVAFSPDGKWLASGGRDSSIRLWTPQGEAQRVIDLHNANSVFSVAFSPDGRLLASGGSDSRLRVWSREGQSLLTQVDQANSVFSVAFDPTGNRVAGAFEQGNVDWVAVPKIAPSPEPLAAVTPPPLPAEPPTPQPTTAPTPAPSRAPFEPLPQGGGGAILPQARVQTGNHVVVRSLFATGSNSLLYGLELNTGDDSGLERGFFYQAIAQGGVWPPTRHMAGIAAKLQFWRPSKELPLALAVGGYGDMAGILYDLIERQSIRTSHFSLTLAGEYDLFQSLSLRSHVQFGAFGLGATWRPVGPLFLALDTVIPFRPVLPGTLDLTSVGGPMLGLSLGF